MNGPAATRRFLVVDDDENVLQLLEDFLKSHDCDVSRFNNGANALKAASQTCFDFCILDMDMPRISGIEVCQGLRALPQFASVPILFLTMNSDSTSIHRALNAGASDFLSKPIVAKMLWLRIELLFKLVDQANEIARLKQATAQ